MLRAVALILSLSLAFAQTQSTTPQFVEVPDVHKDRLTLSSLVIKEDAGGRKENPLGSAAVRIFHPGTSLVYARQVLNAKSGPDNQTELELHTRLYHDGKQIYEGKPIPLDTKGQSDPKNTYAAGAMKLGPGMIPGDYVLQVIVTDKLAKDKYGVTSQSMDFEIE